MLKNFAESTVEEAALLWLAELGYFVLSGPQIAPGELLAERAGFERVILPHRLQDAVYSLNKNIPAEALEEALRKITLAEAPSLLANNRAFHRMIGDGIGVEYRTEQSRVMM